MRYIIGDTHFDHENIIDYCRRPFSSIDEMNETLVERWNNTVGENDTVIHLGDVAMGDAARWLRKLNGQILLIRGNHDGGASQNFVTNVAESATIHHGRYQFHVEHQPVEFGGWQIHGHTHQSDLTLYPFINHERKTVNVSAELVGYKPVAMHRIVRLLEKKERYERLSRTN